MKNIKNPFASLISKVWRNPKRRLTAKIKAECDDLPRNQRLTVVAVLLSAFVLTAFFVFGHACYRLGLGHSRQAVEIEHLRTLELPDNYNNVKSITLPAYDDAGMESED